MSFSHVTRIFVEHGQTGPPGLSVPHPVEVKECKDQTEIALVEEREEEDVQVPAKDQDLAKLIHAQVRFNFFFFFFFGWKSLKQ